MSCRDICLDLKDPYVKDSKRDVAIGTICSFQPPETMTPCTMTQRASEQQQDFWLLRTITRIDAHRSCHTDDGKRH